MRREPDRSSPARSNSSGTAGRRLVIGLRCLHRSEGCQRKSPAEPLRRISTSFQFPQSLTRAAQGGPKAGPARVPRHDYIQVYSTLAVNIRYPTLMLDRQTRRRRCQIAMISAFAISIFRISNIALPRCIRIFSRLSLRELQLSAPSPFSWWSPAGLRPFNRLSFDANRLALEPCVQVESSCPSIGATDLADARLQARPGLASLKPDAASSASAHNARPTTSGSRAKSASFHGMNQL